MTKFMLESAISSLDQALFHLRNYEQIKDDKQLRFVLIHLDGALELFIKKSLMNRGVDIIKKFGRTKGILDSLSDVRREIEGVTVSDDQYLKDVVYLNEIVFLHEFRNDAQHMGSMPKAEQIMEIIPQVLESIQAYIEIFFKLQINELDAYLKDLGIEKNPLQLYFDEANRAYYAGLFEIAFNKKIWAVEHLIRKLCEELLIEEREKHSQYDGYHEELAEILSHESFTSTFDSKELSEIPSFYDAALEFYRTLGFHQPTAHAEIIDGEEVWIEDDFEPIIVTKESIADLWHKLKIIEAKLYKAYLSLN